jgi:3'-phosphoadenosine 5'-phosphosulfate sulfotransferase (PAPS reductase)/FAD synthetase
MNNPFLLETPAVVSFSGGRTSAYMLYRIVEAFGGTLPDDAKVIFANTGKERPETLDFVERCSQRWGVPVTWLEYRYHDRPTFTVVDYNTASRNGEPLEESIDAKRGDSEYLPDPLVRYCTIETKIKTTIRYLRSLGWEHWTNAIGFRADEPQRAAKLNGSKRNPREDSVAPLVKAGITKQDVLKWWADQPFDLELEPHESNCDLCFLKGKGLLLRIMRDKPDLAEWWIRMEERGGRFRNDRPSYASMLKESQQATLFDGFEDDELSIACHCTD